MKIKWRKIKENHKIPALVIYSVADPGWLSRIPGQKIPDPGFGSASKNLIIFNPKTGSKLSEKLSGMFIQDPDPILFHPGPRIRIRDPGVKTAPDPGSGSAILVIYEPVSCWMFCTSELWK